MICRPGTVLIAPLANLHTHLQSHTSLQLGFSRWLPLNPIADVLGSMVHQLPEARRQVLFCSTLKLQTPKPMHYEGLISRTGGHGLDYLGRNVIYIFSLSRSASGAHTISVMKGWSGKGFWESSDTLYCLAKPAACSLLPSARTGTSQALGATADAAATSDFSGLSSAVASLVS